MNRNQSGLSPEGTKGSRRRLVASTSVVILLLVVVGVAILSGGGPDHAKGSDPGLNQATSSLEDGIRRTVVAVAPAGSLNPPPIIRRYRGEIQPRRTSDLAFRRDGRIIEIAVRIGDEVTAGQPLAKLDDRDLAAAVERARADLASAKAQYAEATEGPREQTIAAARQRVEALQAQLAAAVREDQRQRSLMQSGAGSKQAVDDARFAVQRLRSEAKAAAAEWDELREGTRRERIDAAAAQVAVAEAAVRTAEVNQSDATLVAPFAGMIDSRMVDEGMQATPGQTALSIVETAPVEARFGLPPDVAKRLSPAQGVVLRMEDASAAIDEPDSPGIAPEPNPAGIAETVEVAATVDRIRPVIDPVVRTRDVYVRTDRLGLSDVGRIVSLAIPVEDVDADSDRPFERLKFWVPTAALVRGSRGLWAVYVCPPDEADRSVVEKRDVRVLRTTGELSQVQGSVSSGESVVMKGAHRLGPGVPVRVEIFGPEFDRATPDDSQPSSDADAPPSATSGLRP